jgi:hypothetical protein
VTKQTKPEDGSPNDIDAQDKRYNLRLRKFIDIVVEDPLFSAMLFRGAIADLSPTGMRVVIDQYLPKGTEYTFTMKRNPGLTFRGEIRWIKIGDGDMYHAGIQFVDVQEEDRKRLIDFLEIERQRLTNG